MKKILLALAAIVSTVPVHAGVYKETVRYAVKDGQELYLDRYYDADNLGETPCLIFMFGGGFVVGVRDREDYIPYFEYLVEKGYTVVSIDYRLGFKDVTPETQMGAEEFIVLMDQTIHMAVDDLFDATNYILDHAGQWKIDTERIVANGSSAGAVTVLQAEYEICNGMRSADKLPAGFNYAGIIGFAGAVYDFRADLTWNRKPCPIQLFHGNADNHVPYGAFRELGAGFYGSQYIAAQLRDMQSPYYFYSVQDLAHELAARPMQENREEVWTFLFKYVQQKQPLMIDADVTIIGQPVVDKDITLEDFLRANFVR